MNFLVICGSYRSGTTVLAEIFSKHSELIVTSEIGVYKSLNRANNLVNLLNKTEIKGINVGVLTTVRNNLTSNELLFRQKFINHTFKNPIDFYSSLEESSPKQNVKMVGDKYPEYVFDACILKQKYPKMKVLMCIRDGRDVVTSQVNSYYAKLQSGDNVNNHFWCKPSVKEAINMRNNWLHYLNAWEIYKKCFSDYYEVYYREIVKNPVKEAKKISEYLDVDSLEMEKLFTSIIYDDKYNFYKKSFPNINNSLPENWKSMLKKYGFHIE